MINHVRTVLLDIAPPAYEAIDRRAVVPASFVPARDPDILRHRAALGAINSADLAERYAAFGCLIPMLHSDALRSRTLKFDSRVTYQPVAPAGAMPAKKLLESMHTHDADAAGTRLLRAVAEFDAPLAELAKLEGYARACVIALAYVQMREVRNGR